MGLGRSLDFSKKKKEEEKVGVGKDEEEEGKKNAFLDCLPPQTMTADARCSSPTRIQWSQERAPCYLLQRPAVAPHGAH